MPLVISFFLCVGVIVGVYRYSDDSGSLGIFLAFAGSGIAVVFLPFTSGLHSSILSPKNSVRLVRLFGLCLFFSGGFLAFLVRYRNFLG